MKLFGILFAVFGLLFMSVGIGAALWQDSLIRRALPVEATITSTDVERHESTDSDGDHHVSYKPVVRYDYAVDGRAYQGDEVFPLSQSSGETWAREVVGRYRPGDRVGAWYVGDRPERAFLERRHTFLPYVFVLFPMIFMAIGLAVCMAAGASKVNPPAPVANAGGWYELKPVRRIADRRRAAIAALVLWDSVGIAACGHYFVRATPPYGALAIVMTVIYFAIGSAAAAAVVYFVRLARNIGDAQVFVNTPRIARGQPITVAARQAMANALFVEAAAVALVCTQTTRTRHGSRTHYASAACFEREVIALEKKQGRAGERLEYAAQFTLPADAPATSRDYPRHAWCIRLRVQLPASPDYRADFPVVVE